MPSRVPCTGSGNGADSYTSRDPRTTKRLYSLTWFPKWTRLFLDANTSPSAHAIVTLPDDEASSEHGHLPAHSALRAQPALTPSTGPGDGHQHSEGARAFWWMEIKQGNCPPSRPTQISSHGHPRRGADLPLSPRHRKPAPPPRRHRGPTCAVLREQPVQVRERRGSDLRITKEKNNYQILSALLLSLLR